jgi:hypothetical protein
VDNPALAWPVSPGLRPVPMVVLAHTLPSGSVHWDVLVARDSGGGSPLWSLRCERRPDGAAAGDRIAAIRRPDHHPRWLRVDVGEVSGGRGIARRVAAGTLRVTAGGVAEVQWAAGGCDRWQRGPRSLIILDRGPRTSLGDDPGLPHRTPGPP